MSDCAQVERSRIDAGNRRRPFCGAILLLPLGLAASAAADDADTAGYELGELVVTAQRPRVVKAVSTISEITLDDIQALVNEYIDQSEENRVIFVTAPEDTNTPTEEELLTALKDVAKESLSPYDDLAIDEPLMAEKPKAGQIRNETYSEEMGITTIEFDNGVSVALKPTTFKNDEIRFSSLREGGYSLSTIDNFDNASMAAILVNGGGLSKFNALQLERILSGKPSLFPAS